MRAIPTILWCLIAQQQQATPSASAPASIAKVTTRPVTSRPTSQPSSATAIQFSALMPEDTLYRVMKGKITRVDRDSRKLSFTWRNPHTIKDTPLTLKIKDGVLAQIDYQDVPLDQIRPGEATIMTKIEQRPDGKGQQLTATAVRQERKAATAPAR